VLANARMGWRVRWVSRKAGRGGKQEEDHSRQAAMQTQVRKEMALKIHARDAFHILASSG
jgi:hypothetical protein